MLVRSAGSRPRGGFALVMVLFVLLALLVLAAPFLMTARTAERAGAQARDRAAARITLDAATRHTRAVLEQSHPSTDPTPWVDSEAELEVSPLFPEGFLDPSDPTGAMWDVESEDLAGRIDLSSCSPHVIANLLDLTTLLSRPITSQDDELRTAGLGGLSPEGGTIRVGGELMRYGSSEGGTLRGLARGIGTEMQDGVLLTPGQRPSSGFALGQPVIDARAWAICIRRTALGELLAPLDSMEQLNELQDFTDGPALEEFHLDLLREAASVHGGLRGGAVWQRPARMVVDIDSDLTGLEIIRVDNRRWFTEGTTVMVTDGIRSELRVVIDHLEGGFILDRKLEGQYLAYRTLIYPLSRRPVNINTATPVVLEALLNNLSLRDRNSRIDRQEARQLAALIVEKRPFDNMQDFLERLVLPSAGIADESGKVPESSLGEERDSVIDSFDAEALYRNALNANDFRLQYATMPFCFSSRDVYAHELRATINAPSGVVRATAVRERVELLAPQGELFQLWARQEDFDEALRLPRTGAWWMTGPRPTTRWEDGTVPPTRFSPNWGSVGNAPFDPESYIALASELQQAGGEEQPPPVERIFADRGEDGFAQLWPVRSTSRNDLTRIWHFDYETRDLEGRYLPDQTIQRSSADLGWTGDEGLLEPFSYSTWFRERDRTVGGLLLDVRGEATDVADRISLSIEAEDLVLRVYDGYGDHLATGGFEEVTEVRYALADGNSPGLPVDVWNHVSVDVAGSRPDQITMLVNGTTQGVRYEGMSRLASPLSPGSSFISLEDGTGFPDQGVVRIGNELIEYIKSGENQLDATWNPDTAFGGRLARERFDDSGPPPDGGVPIHVSGNSAIPSTALDSHPAGTSVSLYGYSTPLRTPVLSGGGELGGDLGVFRAARVIGVSPGQGQEGNPIATTGLLGPGAVWGQGITDQSTMQLSLVSADIDQADESVMAAFNSDGGYALIVQADLSYPGDDVSLEGLPIGGGEIVRYSGYNGNVLNVVARGDTLPFQPRGEWAGYTGGRHAFIVAWQQNFVYFANEPNWFFDKRMDVQTYVVPISISVGETGAFEEPVRDGEARFAQITRTDAPAFTEWVRYDEVDAASGQLVRTDLNALRAVHNVIIRGDQLPNPEQVIDDDDDGPGPGGPGGTGGTGGVGGLDGSFSAVEPPPVLQPIIAAPPAAPAASAAPAVGPYWEPVVGTMPQDLASAPLSLAIYHALGFRGVMETYPQAHSPGAAVLPVFSVTDPGFFAEDLGLDWGRPGKGDAIFLVGENDPSSLGWPLVVHRSHAPRLRGNVGVRPVTAWEQSDPEVFLASEVDAAVWNEDFTFQAAGVTYFAFEEPSPSLENPSFPLGDARLATRIVKFPSGELPRLATGVGIGTSGSQGGIGAGGNVPSAIIDELKTSGMLFGRGGIPGSTGAAMVLAESLGEEALSMRVIGGSLRTALGLTEYIGAYNAGRPGNGLTQAPPGSGGAASGLRQQGGILRIAEELIAYEGFSGDTIQIAPGGRGVLGSEARPHAMGEPIQFVESLLATTLSGAAAPGDEDLLVVGSQGFGNQGTVLIGQELVHFTRNLGASIGMPALSVEPGAMDEEGAGIFRGRYGTQPGAHQPGTPVIVFPARYWDRWADRADAPEMAWMGFEIDQPGAYWLSTFFDTENAGTGGSRIEALVRTDPRVPWDADPDLEPGLFQLMDGMRDGEPIELLDPSDRLEIRVYVRYDQGAFDPQLGLAHGWKMSPRLRHVGAEYLAPRRVLESVDR